MAAHRGGAGPLMRKGMRIAAAIQKGGDARVRQLRPNTALAPKIAPRANLLWVYSEASAFMSVFSQEKRD